MRVPTHMQPTCPPTHSQTRSCREQLQKHNAARVIHRAEQKRVVSAAVSFMEWNEATSQQENEANMKVGHPPPSCGGPHLSPPAAFKCSLTIALLGWRVGEGWFGGVPGELGGLSPPNMAAIPHLFSPLPLPPIGFTPCACMTSPILFSKGSLESLLTAVALMCAAAAAAAAAAHRPHAPPPSGAHRPCRLPPSPPLSAGHVAVG